jgi:hypothetical protein
LCCALRCDEFVEQLLGSGAVAFGMNRSLRLIMPHGREKHERVMQFVCICCFRPRFFFDFFNCSGVENAEPVATISF